MHADAPRIIELFDKYPTIKLCLSGHIHLYEQILYNGITYISNGAVSGNWWKGMRYRTANGYAMVNLYNDGSFDNEYVPCGWEVSFFIASPVAATIGGTCLYVLFFKRLEPAMLRLLILC